MHTLPDNMVDLLRARAADHADAPAFTFLRDGDHDEVTWTFAELDRRARAIAVALSRRVEPGQRVLLLYPQGLDFLAALFGCMYAGVLAVPLQPPGKHRARAALPKLEAIVADGGVAIGGTTSDLVDEMRAVVGLSPSLRGLDWLATDGVSLSLADGWVAPPIRPSDLAYLQYTSGSTSAPKGVMVSHANLLYNLRTFDINFGHDASSVMVSWLPTFHDLGLVYGGFMPVYGGFRGVLLDPLHFLRRPMRWIEAIARFHGTHAPAPNFAFELAATRSTPEERAAVDLSRWRVALNGAEPIRYDTEARFVEAFAASGVTWRTMRHAYGMSEATAVIAKEPVDSLPVFLDVDGASLERHQVAIVDGGAPGARRIAGCGVCVDQTTVRIVDPDTLRTCPPDGVGEIWVGGPTVAQGYWNQPEATTEGFRAHTADTGEGPFLRTGDLGFVWHDNVFVTGRHKDLIIVRGENHYPQDLEWDVQNAHPAIRPSCVAAFALPDRATDAVGVVAEVYADKVGDPEAVFAAVREVLVPHGLSAATVALIKPSTIDKTSSGKIMRRRARERLLLGEHELIARWDAPAEVVEPVEVDVSARLAAAPLFAREALLVAHIASRVAARLGVDVAVVDPEAPLRELGLDSVGAVELAERLSRDVGLELGATALWDHPTARALARHVLGAAAPVSPVATGSEGPRPDPDDAPAEDATDAELAALLAEELKDL